MKKSIIISSVVLSTLVIFNIYLSVNVSSLSNFPLFNTEALANGEGGSSVGSYYQIIAGCRNYSMSNWINRCCKGSSVSCKHDPCNYQIVEGCDKFGRQDI